MEANHVITTTTTLGAFSEANTRALVLRMVPGAHSLQCPKDAWKMATRQEADMASRGAGTLGGPDAKCRTPSTPAQPLVAQPWL